MRTFRRRDIAAVRLVAQPGDAPVTLTVAHCDLYFFFDVDVVLLNLEVLADHLSLALMTGAGASDADLPYADQHMADFEQRYCWDRFWSGAGAAPNRRYLCNGHALVVVGHTRSAFFCDSERGVLAQFRHQHFLLFLTAHLQKAALLIRAIAFRRWSKMIFRSQPLAGTAR